MRTNAYLRFCMLGNRSIGWQIMIAVLVLAFFQAVNPYSKGAEILKGGSTIAERAVETVPTVPTPPKMRAKKRPEITGNIIPLEIQHPLLLSADVLRAVDVSNSWATHTPVPTEGKDGRVVFNYGEGEPTIVTSVFQVTEVDLQPGEEIAPDALDCGDCSEDKQGGGKDRFQISVRKAGEGGDHFQYLVIKPGQSGLDTTLIVGTNRRSYYMRLVSTESQHLVRVAFRYPADEERARLELQARLALAEENRRREEESRKKAEVVSTVRHTNYEVKIKGKYAEYLRPVEHGVWDDGIHSHIKLPGTAKYRGLPVPKIENATGPMTANYHWDESELVVDAIFEKACLVEGVGRKAQKMCVTNLNLKSNGRN